jgi:hypothetical protein
MRNILTRCVLPLAAVSLAILSCPAPSNAQKAGSATPEQLPSDFLKTKPIMSGSNTAGKLRRNATGTATPNGLAAAAVPAIDTLTYWTGAFTAPGYDSSGNPQSVWPYEMVGTAPETGSTTVINAPIIPVTVRLLDADGSVAVRSGVRLVLSVSSNIVNAVVQSPEFQSAKYTSGSGQLNDQMMRAQFNDRLSSDDDSSWHTLLSPRVKRGRVMSIPYGNWAYALNADGSCCAFALVEASVFSNLLFPPTYPVDNSTVIGAAELAGDMTTHDLTTLLFNNVYLYNTTVANCCVLGFHNADVEPGIASNGNRTRLYVMDYASWMSNGLFSFGFQDITAFSHELAETFNDPFADNATPWWLSVDPVFGSGQCQNILETGDVVEVLNSLDPVFSISMNGRTYHPQNEAMFPWFAFESPSSAHLGAYSFPDETTLTTLSPGPLLPGCQPVP